MVQQIISVGANANDGTGDPLRTAMIKINENFSEIYGRDAAGSNFDLTENTITAVNTNGNIELVPNGTGSIKLDSLDTYVTGNANIAGNADIAGDANIAGNANISADANITGNVTIGGTLTAAGISVSSIANGNSNVVVAANSNVSISVDGTSNIAVFSNAGATVSGNVNVSGNIRLTGLAARIVGEFTNTTQTDKTIFVTGNSNANSHVLVVPNGTSTGSSWQALNNTDPTNAGKVMIFANGTSDMQLVSGRNGSGTYLPLTLWTNNAAQMSVGIDGTITVSGSFGYSTGGNIAQSTDKSTAVTLNAVTGRITCQSDTLNADTSISFTLNNTYINADDHVIISHESVGTLGAYGVTATPSSNSATITVRNNSTGNLGEAIVLKFSVLKSNNG